MAIVCKVVCIANTYADVNNNRQNVTTHDNADTTNISAIEHTQNGDVNNNNLFDSNSNTSLESFLDALEQNPNDVVNNETEANNGVSALNKGFIQTTNFQNTGENIHDVHQQGQPFSTDVCHELQLDFRAGHTYIQTMASTASSDSSYVKNITSHAD